MQPYLRTIATRPKTDSLKHYLALEAECKNASPLVDREACPTTTSFSPAGGAADLTKTLRDIALGQAMRCAEFEARHTGPFNWSGKESKR